MLFFLLACSLGSAPSTHAGTDMPPSVVPASVDTPPVAALPALAAERWRLGERSALGSLAIWPILDSRPAPTGDYLSLADGLADGRVKVEEKDGGTVPALSVRNTSDRPLLLAAGDVVTGGRQDRVVIADQVVPAGASADVAVNCVEHGRWSGGASFGYGGRAEYGLKEAVELDNEQGKTWAKVEELNEKKKAILAAKGVVEDELAPSTGTYRASIEADSVKAEAAPYARLVREALSGTGVVGLVVAFDGVVVGSELYGSPALLAASRDAIAQGVARDAVSRGQGTHAPPSDADARAFLSDAVAAPAEAPEATGGDLRASTEGVTTRGKDLRGSDGTLIHKSSYKK